MNCCYVFGFVVLWFSGGRLGSCSLECVHYWLKLDWVYPAKWV